MLDQFGFSSIDADVITARANYETEKEAAFFNAADTIVELTEKVEKLDLQLQSLQDGHKHDVRNSVLLSVFSAFAGGIIGTALTILATQAGLL